MDGSYRTVSAVSKLAVSKKLLDRSTYRTALKLSPNHRSSHPPAPSIREKKREEEEKEKKKKKKIKTEIKIDPVASVASVATSPCRLCLDESHRVASRAASFPPPSLLLLGSGGGSNLVPASASNNAIAIVRSKEAAPHHPVGQIRGRPEISPDQREKYLQRLQQVQQQGHGILLNVTHLSGANQKQFPLQPENAILQQFNSKSSPMSPQVGLGLNTQSPVSSVSSTQLQNPIHHLSSQNPLISTGPKDVDIVNSKVEEQQKEKLSDDVKVESTQSSGLGKIESDDNLKTPQMVTGTATEGSQLPRESDLSPGQPLQSGQPSASLGVIGRRSVSDLGAIGDNLGGLVGNSGGTHDQFHTLQLLEAALHRLPQPKDSEGVKRYVPRQPAATPPSFPQTQADIIRNPALWKRLGPDPLGIDTLFFAFYYQQNTYQQYLAARELKRQSWRYHKQYSTWFQRHEEPEVTTDDYEKGTYLYFDFHLPDSWCQRIKGDFTFEYKHLEDELVV